MITENSFSTLLESRDKTAKNQFCVDINGKLVMEHSEAEYVISGFSVLTGRFYGMSTGEIYQL